MSSYGQKGYKTVFTKPSKTKQAPAKACDIRTILEKHRVTGVLSRARGQAMYGDFTQVPADYQTAMQIVTDAHDKFAALPARIRDRFDNDPANFVSFFADEKNYDEAVKLGFVQDKPIEVKPDGGSTPSGATGSSGGDLGGSSTTSTAPSVGQ